MGNKKEELPIRVAVVGAGYWGPNLIRDFSSLANSEVAIVCDLNSDRLAEVSSQYPHIRTSEELGLILTDPEIEAVVVATPADRHREVAEKCLKAGKHVFVEKPLATSVADAQAIVTVAEENDRVLMVGHIFRYDSTIEAMIELIRSGKIGNLRYIHGIRTSMGGTARPWDTNILWDALVHDAYLFPAIAGRQPRRVLAVGQAYLDPKLEDVAFVTFDFGGGLLGHVYVSWYALEKVRQITVVGEKSILAYDDLAKPRLNLYARRYEQSEQKDPLGHPRWYWRDNGKRAIEALTVEPLKVECQHFVDCVVGGHRPRTDGVKGLDAVYLLEACQRSLETEGWVVLE